MPSVPAWAVPRLPCWTFVTLESSIFLHLSRLTTHLKPSCCFQVSETGKE